MTTPAPSPVLFAHPQRCVRTIERGMVKRVFLRGPLHAYQLACPFCGFAAMHLREAGGFVEDGEAESSGPTKPGGPVVAFRHVRLVGSGPLECPACRRSAQVVDGVWVNRSL